MAKSFKTIKSPKLGLTDKLTFGKFANCRVVDILPDNWEYLMWLAKNTAIQFDQSVIDEITRKFQGYIEERHYNEEIKPWEDDGPLDDIPF